jgi:putative ABC transport system permease protein
MLKNFFRTAWRNIWKNKMFSVINIGGLAIGLASSLLLLSYISYQFSYDDFHVNKENLYRVGLDIFRNNKLELHTAENYSAAGPALKKDFPEILETARLYNMGYKNNCVFTYNNHPFRERKFLYADASFLSIFSFPFLQGDPGTALSQPYTAVISESVARKIFGDQNPIGKFIKMDDDDRNAELCKITGVFKDIPDNSHIKFNILISYTTLYHRNGGKDRFENDWNKKDFYTYILLSPGTDPKRLETKFTSFIQQHIPGEKTDHQESRLALESLQKIHLGSSRMDEPEATGNGKAMYFLIIIALFIIIIAWVNYINLATAGSVNRAKEIGIRKVLGSRRNQLIKQFLTEALSLNILALSIALLIVYSLLPFLTHFFNSDFSLLSLFRNRLGMLFIGLLIAGIFFSGLYPAFVLSSFKPVFVLKGKMTSSRSGLRTRKLLVVFQFSLSIFLIIGTLTVFQQVRYMLNQDLGINVHQVLVLDRPGRWDTARRTHNLLVEEFQAALERSPAVVSVGMSDEIPGKEIRWPSTFKVKNSPVVNPIAVNTTAINEKYISTLGLHLLAGRNFSLAYKSDFDALILSESAARLLGFNNVREAIGQQLLSDNHTYSIVGVVSDFHQMSLQKKEEPAIFQFNSRDFREYEYYLVKIKTTELGTAIRQIQSAWNESFKGNPFDYYFLDEYFNRQYKSEIQFGILFGAFSFIAIVIACVGLFALVAFMIQQRTKEIGVRKVLGAGIRDLLLLLTKDFVRLVLLANLVAWPLGWYLMNNWLTDFSYRIYLNGWVFVCAALSTLLIALTTICVRAIKATMANPINSLRTE